MLTQILKNSSPVLSQLRSTQYVSRFYQKVLQKDTLSDNVKKAEYAVRGKIPLRGEEIQTDINKGNASKYAFT
jgi:hypothetical protein